MLRKAAKAASALICAAALFACGIAERIEFTDGAGNRVVLPQRPENVAVLFSSFTEIWNLAGGITSVTVGEAVERGFADAGAILVDGGAGKQINLEILAAAEPDLVIGSIDVPAQAEAAAVLGAAGIPCALFRVECLADYVDVLKVCTQITGDEAAFERSGEQVRRRAEEILAAHAGAFADMRVLFIRAGSSAGSAKAKTARDHFAAHMIEELGAHNIADDAPVLLDGLSVEAILQEDPDVILIAPMGDEEAARAYMDGVLAEPAWQALTAVREGRCSYLPKELFQFKPNARWDEAYFMLAELLEAGRNS